MALFLTIITLYLTTVYVSSQTVSSQTFTIIPPPDEVSWDGAVTKCTDIGLVLASIHNATEDIEADQLCADWDVVCWIGLHRAADESQFEWIDGTPLDYTNWYPNHPDVALNQSAAVHYSGLGWTDTPDGVGAAYALCREESTRTTTKSPTKKPVLFIVKKTRWNQYLCEPLGVSNNTNGSTTSTSSPQNATTASTLLSQIECVEPDECPLVTIGCVIVMCIFICSLFACCKFNRRCRYGRSVSRCFGTLLRTIAIATALVQDMIAFKLTPWTVKVFLIFWGFGLIVSIIDIVMACGCPNKLAVFFVCIVEIIQAVLFMWVIKDDPNGNGIYYDDVDEDKVFTHASVMIFSTLCVVQVVCEVLKYKVDQRSGYHKVLKLRVNQHSGHGDNNAMKKGLSPGVIGLCSSLFYGALLLPIAYFPPDSPWKNNAFGFISTFVLWLTLLWRELIFTFNAVKTKRGIILVSMAIFVYIMVLGIIKLDEVDKYFVEMKTAQEIGLENADCWLEEAEYQKVASRCLIAATALCLVASLFCVLR